MSSKQDEAFKLAKEALQTYSLLVNFDDNKPLVLTCDTSPYGLGAVLSHTMDDGSVRPISYASRSLTAAEKGYAKLKKEALSINFGIKKFHNYLYGRKFIIESDLKPLFFI